MLIYLQGARGHMDGTGQRRPIHDVVQTYLQFSNFHFRNGDRPSQEPARRFCFHFHFCTVATICLFYYYSLQWTKLHQNLPQSKDVESILVTICLHDRRQHRRRQLFLG